MEFMLARLAGVPKWVNERAERILEKLESTSQAEENRENLKASSRSGSSSSSEIQMTLFGSPTHPLVDKIKALDANNLTPLNALEMLHQWKDDLSEVEAIETTETVDSKEV